MPALRPYQEVGRDWLLSRLRAGLADEAGIGKTVQACAALERTAKTAVVVCPASVVPVWESHLREWAPSVRTKVMSYDRARRRALTETVDVLILDEAHYLKNPASRRTRAIYGPGCSGAGMMRRAERVWLLTATPAPNHPGEYWPHFRALLPPYSVPTKYHDFLTRYCHVRSTPYGLAPVGIRAQHAQELMRLINSLFLRRRLEDVALDLPNWSWEPLRLAIPDVGDLRKLAAENGRAAELLRVLESVESVDDVLPALEQAAPALSTLRRMTGVLKAPAVVEWAHNYLLTGRKLVVYAVHHDVLNTLHSQLAAYSPVQVIGSSSAAQRRAAVDAFQTDPNCRVFLGQVQAAGTGITLTAASTVLFAELPWTPGDVWQAAKRVHRIGQQHPVQVVLASVADSIDDAVARVLLRKERMMEALQG